MHPGLQPDCEADSSLAQVDVTVEFFQVSIVYKQFDLGHAGTLHHLHFGRIHFQAHLLTSCIELLEE